MRRTWSLGLTILSLAMVAAVGCQDYNLAGPGEWNPAEQPEAIGQTFEEDVFVQRTAERSDVLFVVDNSCSMIEEQTALMDNFWTFAQFFADSGLDFHIGITVLDDYQGQPAIGQLYGSTPYITNDTLDPVGAFTGNMTMGDDGAGACEIGLEATVRALTPASTGGYEDTTNDGFYREDALLSVIIVSDEPDGSTMPPDPWGISDCTYATSWMEFVPWFTTLKGSHGIEQLFFAAIVGGPGGCSSNWGDAATGSGYLEVINALGPETSLFYSICEHDWSDVMVALGIQATGLRTSFHLSLVPVDGTLQVFLDLDGDGPQEEFEIEEDPSFSTPYAFIYNSVTNSLDFTISTMPPEAAELRVVYETAEDA